MSTQIAKFSGTYEARHNSATLETIYEDADLFLVSFWGGDLRGKCIQFTIQTDRGTEYIQLTKSGVSKLVDVLKEWIDGKR